MNNQNFLAVAIRVVALVLAVDVLEDLPNIFTQYQQVGALGISPLFYWSTSLPKFGLLLFAILLWINPRLIIKGIVPSYELKQENLSKGIGEALFAAVGLYIFCMSLTDLYYFVVLKYTMETQLGAGVTMEPIQVAGFYTTIVQSILGLVVMFGHRTLYMLVKKQRSTQ